MIRSSLRPGTKRQVRRQDRNLPRDVRGAGATHLLHGQDEAKFNHQPTLAIVGQQRGSVLGGDVQPEVGLQGKGEL